jgi:hypothetical protein
MSAGRELGVRFDTHLEFWFGVVGSGSWYGDRIGGGKIAMFGVGFGYMERFGNVMQWGKWMLFHGLDGTRREWEYRGRI